VCLLGCFLWEVLEAPSGLHSALVRLCSLGVGALKSSLEGCADWDCFFEFSAKAGLSRFVFARNAFSTPLNPVRLGASSERSRSESFLI